MEAAYLCRILIADDHPVVRTGLAAMINLFEGMTVAGEASNGAEAVRLYRELKPDIVLMDLRMPEMDGVAAIEAIRADYPDAGIIVLTTSDAEEDVINGIQAGARGYLLKDSGHEALLSAIRAVRAGRRSIPTEVADRLVRIMSEPRLTRRERQVLTFVASGKTNLEVASAIGVSESTVKAHMNNVMRKVGAADRTQAVTIALRRGIIRLE